MAAIATVLQQENEQLRSRVHSLEHEKRELAKRVEILAEQLAILRGRLYGRSSEKLTLEQQLKLFAEEASLVGQARELQAQLIPAHIRQRPVRRPLPPDLPREEVTIDIPEEEKRCGCGAELVRIGEEISEKLDVIPPKLRVIRTIRPRYACHSCEGSGDEEKPAVRIARAPAALIDGGIATAGLVAHIVTAKFCDALPLYRQEKQFTRWGVELSRKTMADWLIAVAGACAGVMEAIQRQLRAGPVLNIDETPVQVLGEQDRANTTKSYMWVARGGPPGAPVLYYRYAPSRGADAANQMLGDFQGHVQTDGYEVYDVACNRPGINHVGCWAHARRGFMDAKKSSTKAGAAEQALAMVGHLYMVERTRGNYEDPQEFSLARRKAVTPVLEALRNWLDKKLEQVLPGSTLGQAVSYAHGQWPKLLRYLDHPALTPDNNGCEQAIRPFVVGRKNYLFCGSPRGAEAAATFYSLIETAKANGKEPYWYLRQLFEGLPLAKQPSDLVSLLPFTPAE